MDRALATAVEAQDEETSRHQELAKRFYSLAERRSGIAAPPIDGSVALRTTGDGLPLLSVTIVCPPAEAAAAETRITQGVLRNAYSATFEPAHV